MTMAHHAAVTTTTQHLAGSLSGHHHHTTADPRSATFVERSHLAYMIPATTNLDLEEAFGNIENGESFLDAVQQRQSLFFDETVDILLMLKAPWLEQKTLQAQLDRLVIQVDAQVVNASTSGRNSPPSSDPIFSGTVPDIGDPFIVVDEEEEEGSEGEGEGEGEGGTRTTPYVYAIWKLPIFLARPRMRLQSPSVIFTASASLKPEVGQESMAAAAGGRGKGYLASGTPAGFNVLEALVADPALDGVKPRLSALRVSRVAPVTQQHETRQRIRSIQQVKLPVSAAVHTRIRFSRPNTAPASSTLIALLEVDLSPHAAGCRILLEHINLSVPDATVSCLSDGDPALALPLPCTAHDNVTLLYRIAPDNHDLGPKNSSRQLDISIKASAQLDPGKCTPKLSMAWSTSIDFTTPANPAFGAPPGTGIQRGHRPSQLSISGSQTLASLKSPSVTQPDALPGLGSSAATESNLPDLGITMSFTSAPGPVHVGDTFSWTIHVVNRAPARDTRPPRKLALVAIPRRRRGDFRAAAATAVRPPSGAGAGAGAPDVAPAVMDDNVLHAAQKSATSELTEVACLSADTRVGPLAPGSCHVVEMRFLALREGVVGIEAVRVVDLSTQDHVDIRHLPTVLVKPAASSSSAAAAETKVAAAVAEEEKEKLREHRDKGKDKETTDEEEGEEEEREEEEEEDDDEEDEEDEGEDRNKEEEGETEKEEEGEDTTSTSS